MWIWFLLRWDENERKNYVRFLVKKLGIITQSLSVKLNVWKA